MFADRRLFPRPSHLIALGTLAVLAACQPPPPPPAPPPPVIDTIMPVPPNSAAENMELPEADETGKYATPNQGMTGQQAVWHVRMALNVAALGCRTPGEPARVQYNRMLHIHEAALKFAYDATENYYRGRYGVNAAMMRERTNTIVYNYFALPPAQKAFCDKAVATLTIINGLTPQALLDYAPKALEELEQPFQDFWEAYADYLRRLEEWRRRFGRPTVLVLPCPDPNSPCPGSGPPPPVAPGGAPRLPMEQMPDTPPTRPSQLPEP